MGDFAETVTILAYIINICDTYALKYGIEMLTTIENFSEFLSFETN